MLSRHFVSDLALTAWNVDTRFFEYWVPLLRDMMPCGPRRLSDPTGPRSQPTRSSGRDNRRRLASVLVFQVYSASGFSASALLRASWQEAKAGPAAPVAEVGELNVWASRACWLRCRVAICVCIAACCVATSWAETTNSAPASLQMQANNLHRLSSAAW